MGVYKGRAMVRQRGFEDRSETRINDLFSLLPAGDTQRWNSA
jgi:hypothetical protein